GRRMGQRTPQGLAVQPPPGRARYRRGRIRDAGEDLQGTYGRDAGMADESIPGARSQPGQLDGAPETGNRRRDRIQRGAAEQPVPGRTGFALCARESVSAGQESRGSGHHRYRAADLRRAVESIGAADKRRCTQMIEMETRAERFIMTLVREERGACA